MNFSYVSDDPSRLSVDDVLGLIDWKELETVLASPDDTSRPPLSVDVSMAPMDVEPLAAKPNAKRAPPRQARKTSRPSATATPTATKHPVAAAPAGPPVKKKRIRREIVELKFLRGKVVELEEELRKLQLGFSTSPPIEGEPVPLDNIMPSVWTSMAGRQLKDRMRAERENQELRNMLQDQLKIAQGLEDTLKQLPPSQGQSNEPALILPPEIFGPSSTETLAESMTHLERSYLSVDEAFTTEGVDNLETDEHEIKAILHPVYGTCIRFTTRISMPFNYDVTSRAMWRFITEEGLISLASSFNKIYTTKDIQAHCFAFRLPDSDPAKDYWLNQVVRKHVETNRMVIVGRSTIHPYVKDNRHPTGVSFIDDARVIVSDCSSNGVPQTCVKACVYLVPDFGSGSSDQAVGINELLEFFIKSASPVILRCREMILAMLTQEAEVVKQTESEGELHALHDRAQHSRCRLDTSQRSGKKRVRRIQLELALFRSQVEELAVKLKRVKLQKESGKSPTPIDGIGTNSVWNAIAEWQLRERLRAETHRTELQCSYKGLVDFSTELHKLLRRSEDSAKEVAQQVKQEPRVKFQKLTTEANDEIFSEQLTIVSRLYLELQQQWKWPQTPNRSLHYGLDLSLGEEVVKVDPNAKVGIVLEAARGAMLPFTLDVVVMAFWKFFGSTNNCSDDTTCTSSTDSLARSFSLSTNFDGSFSQLAGKYTCRKFATENEATLVWVERADVEEFGGVKFSGLQYLKCGYLKLRKVPRVGPGCKSTATIVETSTETTPIFRDDVSNQEDQTQALINAAKRSYKTVNTVFCEKMSNLLVEEDWKVTLL